MKEKNVVFISRAWYPNHQLLFDDIQSQLSGEVRLYYYLLSSKERGRTWDMRGKLLRPQVIPGLHFTIFSKEIMINPLVPKYLSMIEPELIIITPWSEAGCFAAKNFAKKKNIPTVSWIVGLREWNPNFWWKIRRILTNILAGSFIKDSGLVFADGTKAKIDAIKLGASEERVIIIKHVIEEDHFYYENIMLTEEKKKNKRAQLLLDDRPIFLCISQLIKRKGIDSLLGAFDILLKKNNDIQLLLVGNGPLRHLVINFYKNNPRNFKWISSVPYEEIPTYYALSDYSVVPSYFDDWCNVVNESHCAKIPVICSDGANASYDLIKHGETGLLYKTGDTKALADCMEYAIQNPQKMKIMAQNGYNFIKSEWNTKESAKIWAKYIRIAIGDDYH